MKLSLWLKGNPSPEGLLFTRGESYVFCDSEEFIRKSLTRAPYASSVINALDHLLSMLRAYTNLSEGSSVPLTETALTPKLAACGLVVNEDALFAAEASRVYSHA